MAYYLTMDTKGQHKILDIPKTSLFIKETNLKQTGACSLKEIDTLTTMFEDEEEFKKYLLLNTTITINEYDNNISIRKKDQESYTKVMYGILYQNSIEYLYPPKLKKEFAKKIEDYEFLDKFVRRFYNYYDCRISISELGNYLSDSKKTGYQNKYLYQRLMEVLNYLIYENGDSDANVKYKNLHMIVAFMAHYDNQKIAELVPSQEKKKIRKKEPLIGQTTLF